MNTINMPARRVWRNNDCRLNAMLDRLDEQSIDARIIATLAAVDDRNVEIIADRAARRAGR